MAEAGGNDREAGEEGRSRALAFGDWIRGRAPRAGLTDELVSTEDELLRLVQSVNDASASRKPAPEEWSLRDLVRHGIDAEERVIHQIESLARGREPRPYNTPPGVVMALDDNGEAFVVFVRRMGSANAVLQALLPEVSAGGGASSLHNDLGPFTAREWVSFQAWHDADHLNQARAILASVSGETNRTG